MCRGRWVLSSRRKAERCASCRVGGPVCSSWDDEDEGIGAQGNGEGEPVASPRELFHLGALVAVLGGASARRKPSFPSNSPNEKAFELPKRYYRSWDVEWPQGYEATREHSRKGSQDGRVAPTAVRQFKVGDRSSSS